MTTKYGFKKPDDIQIFDGDMRFINGYHHCKYCGNEVRAESTFRDHYYEDVEYYCNCEDVKEISRLQREIFELKIKLNPLEKDLETLREKEYQLFKDKKYEEVLESFIRESGISKNTIKRLLENE